MSETSVRANFLDASALVMKYIKEDGSEKLEQYLRDQPTKYTTPFCFYEALNVLKRKWKFDEMITKDKYLSTAFSMTAWFSHISRSIKEVDLLTPSVFSEVMNIVRRHDLDISDAFQIISVKKGFFSHMSGDSQTLLVTADEELAKAARKEDICSWNILRESAPSNK